MAKEKWYAVVEKDTGRLVSIGTVLADPLPDHLEAIAQKDDPRELAWDEETRSFVDPPTPVSPVDLVMDQPEVAALDDQAKAAVRVAVERTLA